MQVWRRAGEGRQGINHHSIVLGLGKYLEAKDREVHEKLFGCGVGNQQLGQIGS